MHHMLGIECHLQLFENHSRSGYGGQDFSNHLQPSCPRDLPSQVAHGRRSYGYLRMSGVGTGREDVYERERSSRTIPM